MLGRRRQEGREFKVILGSLVSLRIRGQLRVHETLSRKTKRAVGRGQRARTSVLQAHGPEFSSLALMEKSGIGVVCACNPTLLGVKRMHGWRQADIQL